MEIDERTHRLSYGVRNILGRSGAVVQVSGGVDSAVTLHLAVRAFEPQRVIALFLPDRATSPVSHEMAHSAAASAGCNLRTISIDEAVRTLSDPYEISSIISSYFSDYDESTQGFAINIDADTSIRLGTPAFRLHVGRRHGESTRSVLLRPRDLRTLMAAQNIKQRLRMTIAYRHAEQRGYAVVGASNADELELGFTVKFGDDAADVYAIGDLTKKDVRQLAKELGVPTEIQARTPTTDTFTLEQSQNDYYYLADPEALRALASGESEDYNAETMTEIVNIFRKNADYNRQRLRLDWTDHAT